MTKSFLNIVILITYACHVYTLYAHAGDVVQCSFSSAPSSISVHTMSHRNYVMLSIIHVSSHLCIG